jgi:hypothetical protein
VSNVDLASQLEEQSGAILLALRGLDGLNKSAFADLLNTIERCIEAYAQDASIPKKVAAILFDIYPAIVSASYLYDAKETSRIQEAAEQLADRIRVCLNQPH